MTPGKQCSNRPCPAHVFADRMPHGTRRICCYLRSAAACGILGGWMAGVIHRTVYGGIEERRDPVAVPGARQQRYPLCSEESPIGCW